MRKLFFTVALPAILLLLVSCKSADSKIDKISADFCNCFKGMEAKLSDDSKKLISDASNAADPGKSMKDAMVPLSEEKKMQVAQEMAGFAELEDESSETGRCIKDIEKKYDNAYTLNEKKFLLKLTKELEGKPGCGITASLLKIGLKVKN